MSFRHLIRGVFITLLAVLTALPFLAAPVNAAPAKGAQTTADVQRGDDNDVTVKIHNGSLAVKDGVLELRNNAGKALETVPLTYTGKDARTYPIDATVKNNVATLVPSTDVKRSVDTPKSVLEAGKTTVAKQKKQKVICGPQTKKQRDKEALQTLQAELATAATIGGVAGAVIGFILGLGPLSPVAGLAGAAIGALGGLAGAAINGAFARYFGTINQKKFKPKTCYI
ncbi:hypothetical protein [Gordonia hydrophobica]|uniref:DUF8020 domain-containing protein n=1 Tax=Gordonia hydrophobica TaxID=40516 RepID=A0ABZ2U7U3_9ACTN|nr:hypothetical protein [Gordonia hydrophobica]MBM7366108.1 hypothetical protein [Gordonia hydrophobica]